MNFIQALDAKQARENDAIHAPDCAMGTANGKPLHHCGGTYVCPRCDRKSVGASGPSTTRRPFATSAPT